MGRWLEISGEGEAVLETEQPEDLQLKRACPGLVNFCEWFISRLALVAALLYHLWKKEAPWRWTYSQEESWKLSKELLSSAEVLRAYNLTRSLTLAGDAVPFGVVAVLSHRFPDVSECPVPYTSKLLSSAERTYPQLNKEALAIVLVIERFHEFLYGRYSTLTNR